MVRAADNAETTQEQSWETARRQRFLTSLLPLVSLARPALRRGSPIFQVASTWMKPLSFRSAPASWVLAFEAVGTRPAFGYSFWQLWWDSVDPSKALTAWAGEPAACGQLTPWQELQQFPSSYPEFFISGSLPALPLKTSATFVLADALMALRKWSSQNPVTSA